MLTRVSADRAARRQPFLPAYALGFALRLRLDPVSGLFSLSVSRLPVWDRLVANLWVPRLFRALTLVISRRCRFGFEKENFIPSGASPEPILTTVIRW